MSVMSNYPQLLFANKHLWPK